MAKRTSVPSGAKKWVATSVSSIAGIAHEMVSETNIYKVTSAAGSVVRSAAESTIEFGKNLKEQTKNKKLMANLGKSQAVKKANSIMKAGIDDIKSGNFGYRQSGGGMFSLDDDGEFSFDMDLDEYGDGEEGASAATMAQADMMEASTSATIMSNTALAKSMTLANLNAIDASATKITSATLGGFNLLNANITRQTSFIENINNNVQSLLEFYNSNVSQTNQATLKFMDKAAETFELINESYKTKKENTPKTGSIFDDFFKMEEESLIGSLFGQYASFDTLASTIEEKKDELIEGAKDLITGFLPAINLEDPKAMVQSIIRSAVAGGLKNLVPKDLREAMGAVDQMLPQAVGKAMLNNTDNFGVQLVTELLGIDIKSDTRLKKDMASIRNLNRGAMEFNGDTQRAITEVIPDFLSQIEFNTRTLPEYTNKSQGIMVPDEGSRQYVNYKTGKIESADEMQERLMKDMQKMYEDAMEDARAEIGNFALKNGYNEKEASKFLNTFMQLSFQASQMGLSWDNQKVLDAVSKINEETGKSKIDQQELIDFLRAIAPKDTRKAGYQDHYNIDQRILDNNQFQAIKTFNKFFTDQANGSNRYLRQSDLDDLWSQFMATPMLDAYEGLDNYGSDYLARKREKEYEKAGGIAKLKGKVSGKARGLRDKLGGLISIDPSVSQNVRLMGSQLYSVIGGGAALGNYAELIAQNKASRSTPYTRKFAADHTPDEILADYNLYVMLNEGGFQELYDAYERGDLKFDDIQSRVKKEWGAEYATPELINEYIKLFANHEVIDSFRGDAKIGTDVTDARIARHSKDYATILQKLQMKRQKQHSGIDTSKAKDESKKIYDEIFSETGDKVKAQKAASKAYTKALEEAQKMLDTNTQQNLRADQKTAAQIIAQRLAEESGNASAWIYMTNRTTKSGITHQKGEIKDDAFEKILQVMTNIDEAKGVDIYDENAYKMFLPSGMEIDSDDIIRKAFQNHKEEYYSLRGSRNASAKPTKTQILDFGSKIYYEAYSSLVLSYGKEISNYYRERFINEAREEILDKENDPKKKKKKSNYEINALAKKKGTAAFVKAYSKKIKIPVKGGSTANKKEYVKLLVDHFESVYGLQQPSEEYIHDMYTELYGESVLDVIDKEKEKTSSAKIAKANAKMNERQAALDREYESYISGRSSGKKNQSSSAEMPEGDTEPPEITQSSSGVGGGAAQKRRKGDDLYKEYMDQFKGKDGKLIPLKDAEELYINGAKKYNYKSADSFRKAIQREIRSRKNKKSQSGESAAEMDDDSDGHGKTGNHGTMLGYLGESQFDDEAASLQDVVNSNKGLVIGLFESFLNPAYEQIFGSNGILRKFTDSQFAQDLKTSLLGTPDSNGIYKNGMFSDLANDLADTGDYIKYIFTGKGYTNRAGETFEDDDNSIGHSLKEGASKAYDFTMQHLFGEDYKNNETFKKTFGAVSDWMTERKEKKQQYRDSLEVDNGSTSEALYIDRDGKASAEVIQNLSNNEARTAKKRAEDEAERLQDNEDYNMVESEVEAEQARKERLLNRTRDARQTLWSEAGIGLNYIGERINTLLYGDYNEEVLKNNNFADDMIEELQEAYKTPLKEKVVGAGAGAILGGVAAASTGGHLGLLGSMFLPAFPLGGAIVGGAIGILSRSEKFKDFLFGPKDEDGTRAGGLLSKEMYASIKKSLPHAVGGAVLGGLKGLFLPNFGLPGPLGFLMQTLLPGGPLGGAIVGMGASMIWHNEKFRKMLFGEKDDESGEYRGGMISGLANKVGGFFNKNKDSIISGAKGAILGGVAGGVIHQMGYLGAALTPGGPIGGAIAGLGIGILSHNDRFKKWLFGEKDEKGNRISDGLFQRTYNLLNATILDDMKGVVDEAAEGIAYFWKVDVALAAEKALDPLRDLADTIKDKIDELFEKIKDGVFALLEQLFKPITTFVYTKLLKPLGGILKNVTFGAAKITGKMLTAPLKMFNLITAPKRTLDTMKMYRAYLNGEKVIGGKKVDTGEVDENGNPIYRYENVGVGEKSLGKRLRNIIDGNEDDEVFNNWIEAYMESKDKGWAFDYRKEKKIKKEREQSHFDRRKDKAQKKVTQKWAQILGGEGTKNLTEKQLRDFKLDITKLHKQKFGKRFSLNKMSGLTDEQYKELMSGDHDSIMDFIYHRDEYMKGGKGAVDKLLGRSTGPIGKAIDKTGSAIVDGLSNVSDGVQNLTDVVKTGLRGMGIETENAGTTTSNVKTANFIGPEGNSETGGTPIVGAAEVEATMGNYSDNAFMNAYHEYLKGMPIKKAAEKMKMSESQFRYRMKKLSLPTKSRNSEVEAYWKNHPEYAAEYGINFSNDAEKTNTTEETANASGTGGGPTTSSSKNDEANINEPDLDALGGDASEKIDKNAKAGGLSQHESNLTELFGNSVGFAMNSVLIEDDNRRKEEEKKKEEKAKKEAEDAEIKSRRGGLSHKEKLSDKIVGVVEGAKEKTKSFFDTILGSLASAFLNPAFLANLLTLLGLTDVLANGANSVLAKAGAWILDKLKGAGSWIWDQAKKLGTKVTDAFGFTDHTGARTGADGTPILNDNAVADAIGAGLRIAGGGSLGGLITNRFTKPLLTKSLSKGLANMQRGTEFATKAFELSEKNAVGGTLWSKIQEKWYKGKVASGMKTASRFSGTKLGRKGIANATENAIMSQGVIKKSVKGVMEEFESAGGLQYITKNADDAATKAFEKVMKSTGDEVAAKAAATAAREESIELGKDALRKSAYKFGQEIVDNQGAKLLESGGKEALEKAVREGMADGMFVAGEALEKAGTNAVKEGAEKISGGVLKAGLESADDLAGKAVGRAVTKSVGEGTGKATLKGIKDVITGQKSIIGAFVDLLGSIFKGVKNFVQKLFGGKVVAEFAEFDVVEKELIKAAKSNSKVAEIVEKSGAKNMKNLLRSTSAESKELVGKAAEVVAKQKGAVAEQVGKETVNQIPFLNIIFALLGCITAAADVGVVAKRFMVHTDKVNFLMRTCSGVYGLIENFPHIGTAIMIIDLVMDLIFHKSFASIVCTILYKAVCAIFGHIEMAATVVINTLMTAALGPVSVLVNMASKLLSGKTLGGWAVAAVGGVAKFFGFDPAEAAKKKAEKWTKDLEEGQAEFQRDYEDYKMNVNGAITLDAYNDEQNKSWGAKAWDATKNFFGWNKKSDAEIKSGYQMIDEANAANMSTVPEDYSTSFDNANISSININSAYIPMGGDLSSMNVGQLNTEATTFENSGIPQAWNGYDFANNSVFTTPGYGKSDEYMKSVYYGTGRAVGFGDTQNDPRWANVPIGKMPDGSVSTMATGGCGPTALSNVANYLEMGKAIGRGLMEKFNPVSIAKYANSKGYLVDGGSSAALFDKGSSELGLNASRINSSQIGSSLDKGPIIVAGKSNGSSDVYTSPGHILTAYGRSGSNALIDDGMHSGIRKVPISSLAKGFTHGWSYGDGFEKKSVGGGPSIGFGAIIDTRTFGSYQLSKFVNQFYNKSIKRIDNEISLANKIHILITNFIDVISRSSNNESLGHMNSTLAAFREFFDTFLSNYTSIVNQNQSALKSSYDKAADYYETEVVQNDGKNVVVKIAVVPKSEVATLFSIYERDVTNDMQKIASLIFSILHMKVLGNLCTAILSVVENTTKIGGLKLLSSYMYKKLYPTSNVLTNAQTQYELDLTRLQNGEKNSAKAGGSEKAKMDELVSSGNTDNYNTKTSTNKKTIWSSVVSGVKKIGSAVKSAGKAVKSGLSKAWNWTKSVLGYGPGEGIINDTFDGIGNFIDGYNEVINQTNRMTSSALGYGGNIDANKVVKWVTSSNVLGKSTFPDGTPSTNMCGKFARLALEAGGAASHTTGGDGNTYPRTNKIKPGSNGKINYSKIGVGVPIGIKYGVGGPGLAHGHVGIYIGNGMLVDAGGMTVQKRNLDDWYRSFVTNNANGGYGKTNEMGWSYTQPGGYEITPHNVKASVSTNNDTSTEVSDDIAGMDNTSAASSFTNDTPFTKLADIIINKLGLSGLMDSGADKYSVFSDSGVTNTTPSSSGSASNYKSSTKDGSFNGVSLQFGDMKKFSKLSESQIKTILEKKWAGGHSDSIFTAANAGSYAKMIAKAQDETNISAIVPLMIGAWESGWGTSNIAKSKLNFWGWGATNKNPYANAKAFGSNIYEAFKGYTTDFIGTYYDDRGAKSINDVGTGNNKAHLGYAYTDGGQISMDWAPNVASVGKSQLAAIGYGSLSRNGVINLASMIKKAAAAKGWTYGDGLRDLTIGNKTMKVRPDCSGLVSSVLMFSDNLPSGQPLDSSSITDKNNSEMKSAGFSPSSYNKSKLQAGDVVAKNGHTEIYAGKIDGVDKAYNWGYTSGVQSASPTGFSNMAFTTTWKPGGSGNGNISGGSRVVPVNIIKDLLTPGEAHGRAGLKLDPSQIAIHWTADPGASAKNIRKWFESGAGGNHTSSHYVVGLDGEIIQMVPENEQCAATNDENATAIAIETCVNDMQGKFSPTTENSLINLTANIAQRNGISVDGIIRHYDAHKNGAPRLKDCPRWWAPNGPNPNAESDWKAFKNKVKAKMATGKVVSDGDNMSSGAESDSSSSFDPLLSWIQNVSSNLFGGFLSGTSQDSSGSVNNTFSGSSNKSSSSGSSKEIPSDAGNSGEYASPHTATIWNTLRKLGYSKESTSAVMGNMYQESGINPTVVNSIGATGLAQWLGGRLANLKNYAKSKGKDWSDVATQTEWVDQEMQGKDSTTLSLLKKKVGGYEAYKKLTDINKAVEVFETSFERAGVNEANIPRRQAAANAYFNKFSSIGGGGIITGYDTGNDISLIYGTNTSWSNPAVDQFKDTKGGLSVKIYNDFYNSLAKYYRDNYKKYKGSLNKIAKASTTYTLKKYPGASSDFVNLIGSGPWSVTVNDWKITNISYLNDTKRINDITQSVIRDSKKNNSIPKSNDYSGYNINYNPDKQKWSGKVNYITMEQTWEGLQAKEYSATVSGKYIAGSFFAPGAQYSSSQPAISLQDHKNTIAASLKAMVDKSDDPYYAWYKRNWKHTSTYADFITNLSNGKWKIDQDGHTTKFEFNMDRTADEYVEFLRRGTESLKYAKNAFSSEELQAASIKYTHETAKKTIELVTQDNKSASSDSNTEDGTTANEYGVEPAALIADGDYTFTDPYTNKDSIVHVRNGAVYYSQNGDLWKDIKTTGNNTIGGTGCQFTVYDMLASSMSMSKDGENGPVSGFDFNPKTVMENEGLKDPDGTKKYFDTSSGIITQDGVNKLMVDFHEATGGRSISADTNYKGDPKAALERLATEISSSHRYPAMITGSGEPYTSGGKKHALFVTGISDDGSKFLVNDPGDSTKQDVVISDLTKGFEQAVLFKGTKDGQEYGLGDLIDLDTSGDGIDGGGEETKEANWMTKLTSIIIAKLKSLLTGEDYQRVYDENGNFIGKTSLAEIFGLSSGESTDGGMVDEAEFIDSDGDGVVDTDTDESEENTNSSNTISNTISDTSDSKNVNASGAKVGTSSDDGDTNTPDSKSGNIGNRPILLEGVKNKIINYLNAGGNEEWKKQILNGGSMTFYSIGKRVGNILPPTNSSTVNQDKYCVININNGKIANILSVDKKSAVTVNRSCTETMTERYNTQSKNTGIRTYRLVNSSGKVINDLQSSFRFNDSDTVILTSVSNSSAYLETGGKTDEHCEHWEISKATGYGDNLQQNEYKAALRSGKTELASTGDAIAPIGSGPDYKPAIIKSAPIKVKPTSMKSSKATHSDIHKAIYGNASSGLSRTAMGPGSSSIKSKNVTASDELDELLKGLSDEERNKMQTQISRAKNILNMSNPKQAVKTFKSSDMAKTVGYGSGSELSMSKKIMSELKSTTPASSIVDFGKYSSVGHGPEVTNTTNKVDVKVQTGEVETKMDTMITYLRMMANSITNGNSTINLKEVKNEINNFNGKSTKSVSKTKTTSSSGTDLKKRYSSINKGSRYATT